MTVEGEGSGALCPRRSPQVALSRKGCQDHAPLAAPATCAVLPLEEKVVTEGVAVGGTGSLVVAQRTFSPGEQNSPARQSPRAGCAAGALWPDPAFCWRCEAGGSPSNPFRPATVCCRTSSPCLRAPALTEGRHLGLQHNDRASAPLTPCAGNGHDRPPGLHIPHALRASVCPVGVPADAPVTRRSIALRLVRRCALRWVYLMLSRFGWV